MKLQKVFKAMLCLVLLVACSPKINTTITSEEKLKALAYDAKVYSYAVYDSLPKTSKHIASISVSGGSYLFNCDYATMLDKANTKAREIGANIVKIKEYMAPGYWTSNCHRIKVDLYQNDAIDLLDKLEFRKSQNLELIDADYALLHVYRFHGPGPLVSYNVQLGDSILCRVKNNFRTSIKITKEGLNNINARTEALVELPFDVDFGKEYYLRCAVKPGLITMRPFMEFVPAHIGKAEMYSFLSP